VPNFEQALIDLGHDNIIDGVVLTSSIDTITLLDVEGLYIYDLTGIEGFTALTGLNCSLNPITSLDVSQNTALTWLICKLNQLSSLNLSQNTALTYLDCDWNQLTSLDVNQNTALTTLSCGGNQFTSLDVSQNTALVGLYCQVNQITSLDLSQNTMLVMLFCHDNQLTCLNVKSGNNNNFTGFSASSNPNLTCIEVDNVTWSTTNWIAPFVDPASSFSTNCPNPCAVGIKENTLTHISFYPNPTKGVFSIELEEVLQDLKATLTNSVGQVIISENYTSTNLINIDIDAPTGIYFLQLKTSNGELITKKIIKK
jgi:hypothetical protein